MGSIQEDPATHFEDNLPKALDKRLQNFNFQNVNINFQNETAISTAKSPIPQFGKKKHFQKKLWTELIFSIDHGITLLPLFYRFVI